MAQAGVDPTLEGLTPQDAARRAIARRRGYGSGDNDGIVAEEVHS